MINIRIEPIFTPGTLTPDSLKLNNKSIVNQSNMLNVAVYCVKIVQIKIIAIGIHTIQNFRLGVCEVKHFYHMDSMIQFC